MAFKMYPQRGRYLSEEEQAARAEVLNRANAVKLASTFVDKHLKFGGTEANKKIFLEAVLACGLSNAPSLEGSEITTEVFNKVLATVEHQLSPSSSFIAAMDAVRKAFPDVSINDSLECELLSRYRQENLYATKMEPAEAVRVMALPQMRPFLLPNDQWRERVSAEKAHNANIAACARMVKEMTDEYYINGEIKGETPFDKNRFQKAADRDSEFLCSLSTEELNRRYSGWKEEQRLKSLDPDTLRAELRESEKVRLAALRGRAYEPIPPDYNGTLWSRALLAKLGSEMDSNGESKLKNLVRKYSAEAVNELIRSIK